MSQFFFFYVTDLSTFNLSLYTRNSTVWKGFGDANEKGQRCWCYERCFFWSADVAAAVSYAAAAAAAAAVVVLRSSCASALC